MKTKLSDAELNRVAELNEAIDKAKNELVMIRVAAGVRVHPVSQDQTKAVAFLIYSYRCACGAAKRPGRTFCNPCYRALPEKTQKRLRLMLKNSFVMTLLEAVEALGLKAPEWKPPLRTKPTPPITEPIPSQLAQ